MAGVIGLHAGFPPDSCFPVAEAQLTLCDGATASISSATDLALSQQYNLSPRGYGPLLQWCQALTQRLQAPLRPVECLMTTGATHALDMAFSSLLNPGDPLLLEEFTYSHGLDSLLVGAGRRALAIIRCGASGLPGSPAPSSGSRPSCRVSSTPPAVKAPRCLPCRCPTATSSCLSGEAPAARLQCAAPAPAPGAAGLGPSWAEPSQCCWQVRPSQRACPLAQGGRAGAGPGAPAAGAAAGAQQRGPGAACAVHHTHRPQPHRQHAAHGAQARHLRGGLQQQQQQ
jgi:hypothetical protein